jgi:hypothetical protein
MRGRGAPGLVVVAVIAVVAAVLAFQVIRTAAVADRQRRPALAMALWPSHPRVVVDRMLLAIAALAARNGSAPPEIQASIREAANKAPLSPDPFLIAGAVAESEGRGAAAERLLLAARDRDPRSRGTRFLLAERYIRTGRVAAGLMEMQALVSLQARGTEGFGPAVAAYARTPGAVPELRAFFAKAPRVEAAILTLLATDAANADLVLSLASGRPAEPDWRPQLVASLASAGQYARARALWTQFYRLHEPPALFNPGFAETAASPPFSWSFPQTAEGVAEPNGKGGLDVLYYGRANAVLASQLLVLKPGRYRLAAETSPGDGEAGVSWIARCADSPQPLLTLRLRPGTTAGEFSVPPNCQAQWLELQGVAGELPRVSELTVRGLRLAGSAGE